MTTKRTTSLPARRCCAAGRLVLPPAAPGAAAVDPAAHRHRVAAGALRRRLRLHVQHTGLGLPEGPGPPREPASPRGPATTSMSFPDAAGQDRRRSRAVRAAIADPRPVRKQPHVSSVVSPFSPEGARQIAQERTTRTAVRLDQTVSDYETRERQGTCSRTGVKADRPDLQVELAFRARRRRTELRSAPRASACSPQRSILLGRLRLPPRDGPADHDRALRARHRPGPLTQTGQRPQGARLRAQWPR